MSSIGKKMQTASAKILIVLWAAVFASAGAYAGQSADDLADPVELRANSALKELKAQYPSLRVYKQHEEVTRLYGQAFSSGNSPVESADKFRMNYAIALQAEPDDLVPESPLTDKRHTQQLMYNPTTGEYKFTLVYYTQYRDGFPVFRSDLRLLVRNEADYPVVLAASSLHNLGDFRVSDKGAVDYNAAIRAVQNEFPDLSDFSEPETVIWAGVNDISEKPKLAVKVVGSNDFPERWLFVVDVATGEILFRENQIIFEDVFGRVEGMATEGFMAEQCEDEVPMPMPYARVSIGSDVSHTDKKGDYTISHLGSDPVEVTSEIRGLYFRVYNFLGSEAILNQTVTPPGPANFMHNEANTEYVRAQVNAYIQANNQRDLVLKFNPVFPTIATQGVMPIYVNRTDGYCPGNAWYDPGDTTLNFCASGGGYPNTAWQSVSYHEFGHYMVDMAGSGQGQYGEGYGDVMAIIISDDPRLGVGFYGDCVTPLRNADNSYQYPCIGTIHDCGQLLSGCFWSTRNEMIITHPFTYMDTLANLNINSVLLHSGTEITPQITIDWLTLDDDDAIIDNGTPHFTEICAGFSAHNMGCPDLAPIWFEYPNGRPQMVAPNQETTVEVIVNSGAAAPVGGSGKLYYSINGAAFQQGTMTEISANHYEAVLPEANCSGRIDWYVSADASGVGTLTDPAGAPAEFYSSLVATEMVVTFEDDFQTNLGWTVTGSVLDGPWERAIPAGGGDRGDPPTDFDGSGYCYLTDNADGNSDVDEGTTTLISPTIDLSSGEAAIHYARWYSNDFGNAPYSDTMHIYISNDDGSSWTLVEKVGPVEQASGGWYEHSFLVSDYVTPTALIKMRFDASDLGDGSVVEAAIDDFIVTTFLCSTDEPVILTVSVHDWTIGIAMSVQLEASGGTGLLTWTDKLNQLTGTGLSLSSSGLLSGTPLSEGPISFIARVEDEGGQFDETQFDFAINAPPQITTTAPSDWTVGRPYYFTMQYSNGTPPVQWSDKYDDLSGTGLSMGSGGAISGTPLSEGDINFTALVSDYAGASDEAAMSFTINPAVAIITASLPDGKVDNSYSQQLEASGGTGTITWSDKNGDLEGTGLSLSGEGLLSGIPLVEGTIIFTAQAVDIAESSDESEFSINIGPAFMCGDVNADELVNILDITYLIAFLYGDGPEPTPMDAADVNSDTLVNILDITYIINFLYKSGPDPVCP